MVLAFQVPPSGIRPRSGFGTEAFRNVLTAVIDARIVDGSVDDVEVIEVLCRYRVKFTVDRQIVALGIYICSFDSDTVKQLSLHAEYKPRVAGVLAFVRQDRGRRADRIGTRHIAAGICHQALSDARRRSYSRREHIRHRCQERQAVIGRCRKCRRRRKSRLEDRLDLERCREIYRIRP